MPRHSSLSTAKVLRLVLIALAAAYLLAYLTVALLRAGYPFELEWMEGGMLDQTMRLLDGKSLYTQPGIDYVPYVYTPLYFYVSAAVITIVGPGFFALRLVSIASSLVCLGIIVGIAYKETGNRVMALLAASLFAAMFGITRGWFDLGRVDSLFLALLLVGVYLVRFHTSGPAYVAAGVLFALSFLTKQSAAVICAPLVFYCLLTNWRRAILLMASIAIVAGGASILLNTASDGWYWYYTFEAPSRHPWVKPLLLSFWRDDLLGTLPLALACVAIYLVARLRGKDGSLFWLVVLIGVIGASFLNRVKQGSDFNVLMPAYAVIAVLFAMAIDMLLRHIEDVEASLRQPLQILTYVFCILQLLRLVYDPLAQLPTGADRRAGERLVELIANTPGAVYLPAHGYITTLAGKRAHAHSWAIAENIGLRTQGAAVLREDMARAIRQQRFDVIILDEPLSFLPDLETYYEAAGTVFGKEPVFYPVAGGMRIRPETIYIAKR